MPSPTDIDQLAERYLDLWERQSDAVATDAVDLWSFDAWLAMFGAETLKADLEERSGASGDQQS